MGTLDPGQQGIDDRQESAGDFGLKNPLFREKSDKPTDGSLKRALGNFFACYEDLLELTGDFAREWKHYKSSGWILKVFNGKKALFWLVPLEGAMRMSFALRGEERVALLDVRMDPKWLEDLREAKKYSEGYAFRFDLTTKSKYRDAKRIVRQVMKHR